MVIPEGGRDNQIRRTARILEMIQQIVMAPGRWSRQKLAEHYEISQRMIQKDIELIRLRLGLELNHTGVGYEFVQLPHLPIATYSFSEALALLTAARVAQAVPGVNSAELAAAIARLESIFPVELRPFLREATEQLPNRASRAHRQEMLSLLHRAWMERRQVEMVYATGSRDATASQRIVEPYHILPYGRSWQMIAYDHKREAILQFKVDRVQEATLLNSTYTIRTDFNLTEYLGDSWGMMRGSAATPEEVSLLFEPEAGRWVAEEQWHHSQQIEELENGRIRLTFYVGITPEMVSWLMYYGGRVWVERPLWLRQQLCESHKQALARYSST